MIMEESLLPYLLPLLLIPLSFYLLSSLRNKFKNLPPGSTGWPIIGENIKFGLSLGPEKYVKDSMQRYSPEVFRTSLMGEEMAIFCGAQGNKFVFTSENKLLTSWLPKSIKRVFVYPGLEDGNLNEQSALLRSFQHEILKPEALKQYIPKMDAMVRDQIDSQWDPNSVVKVLPLAKKYTFELGCRLFLSVVDPDKIMKLSDPFTAMVKGMFSLPLDLPGTAYNRAIKGGRLVREQMMKIMTERRKELVEKGEEMEGGDVLSKMLLVRDEDGELLSEMDVSHNIMGLQVASFETTSSAITNAMYYLAEQPHVYTEVLREQMEIAKSKGPDELLTWEDIEKMKYSWNVARESLRLAPPALGGFREATSEFRYGGFTIPKGWKTFWTVHSSHKNPKYFPEPEKFDPSRFEGSGPAPYTFVPFGGGLRMCPGKEYARIQILIFMHNVVTRFRIEKAIPNEKIAFGSFPKPAYGLPVRLHPHE